MPFFNAQIQGQRSMFKAMQKNPRRFAKRRALYALTSVLTYVWNRLSGNEEGYRSLPAYQRDMFWNFKTGDNFWVGIPKPFELGVAGSGADRPRVEHRHLPPADKAAKNLRESATRLRLLIEAAISRHPDRRSQVVEAVRDPKNERVKANPLKGL